MRHLLPAEEREMAVHTEGVERAEQGRAEQAWAVFPIELHKRHGAREVRLRAAGLPEWRIEFGHRLRHRSGRGNIQRGRVAAERESRLNRNPDWNTGCTRTGNWSRSNCYNCLDNSYIRTGILHSKSYSNNNRRSTGTRHNILRRTETLFRRSKKPGYSANRVDEY